MLFRSIEESVVREGGGDFSLSETLRELEQEMLIASGNLEYEKAALLRDQIAFFVAAGALVGPKIGAASWLAITVFGQLVASLIVGQFGWLGFPVQPISVARVVGAALLLGGVLLIAR